MVISVRRNNNAMKQNVNANCCCIVKSLRRRPTPPIRTVKHIFTSIIHSISLNVSTRHMLMSMACSIKLVWRWTVFIFKAQHWRTSIRKWYRWATCSASPPQLFTRSNDEQRVIGGCCSVEWLSLWLLCLFSINGLFKRKSLDFSFSFSNTIYQNYLCLESFLFLFTFLSLTSLRVALWGRWRPRQPSCLPQCKNWRERKEETKFSSNKPAWRPTQQLLVVACCFVCRCYVWQWARNLWMQQQNEIDVAREKDQKQSTFSSLLQLRKDTRRQDGLRSK